MNTCCCCNDRLLRHLNRKKIYWFCPTCHQEMPSRYQIYLKYKLKNYGDKSLELLSLFS